MAFTPKAVLKLPVIFEYNEWSPTAVLELPFELAVGLLLNRAEFPTATLSEGYAEPPFLNFWLARANNPMATFSSAHVLLVSVKLAKALDVKLTHLVKLE